MVHLAYHSGDLGWHDIRHDLLLDDDFLHLGLIAQQLVWLNCYAPEEADVLVNAVSFSLRRRYL